ncbi:hypothetical protein Tco_0325064 [Tanacetum coccineum]
MLAVEAQENIAKVQEKLNEEEIEKMVEGDEDEESYASEFANFMINDDVDGFGTRLEPGSHKEHPEIVNDDDDQIETEKKDEEIKKEKKHDDDEKIDEVVMEKDDDDDVEKVDEGVKEKSNVGVATGSMEFRKEKMQTPLPSLTRSPRKVSSSDKIVSEELTAIVSPTTATTSKDSSTYKRKKRPISYKTKILPGSIASMCKRRGQIHSHIKNKFITHDFFMGKIREVLDHCNKDVPELTFIKTNEMINKEMLRLVNLAVKKDHEVDPINTQEIISKEFATHAPKMIEELNADPPEGGGTWRKDNLSKRIFCEWKTNSTDDEASCASDTLDPLSQKLDDENVFLEYQVIPKVGVANALSKPVTSNSAPSTRESKGVDNTSKTRRPLPRINLKNERVPSKFKSSCLSYNFEKIEENHRNLQSFTNQEHTSPECNNVKLAIQNEKYEVIYATCKQCLTTANHDECVLHM